MTRKQRKKLLQLKKKILNETWTGQCSQLLRSSRNRSRGWLRAAGRDEDFDFDLWRRNFELVPPVR